MTEESNPNCKSAIKNIVPILIELNCTYSDFENISKEIEKIYLDRAVLLTYEQVAVTVAKIICNYKNRLEERKKEVITC